MNSFLGMRISHSFNGGYDLDQEASNNEMVLKFGLRDVHFVTTPIGLEYENDLREVAPLLRDENSDKSSSGKDIYSIVGSLLWLARCTCRTSLMRSTYRVSDRTQPLQMTGSWLDELQSTKKTRTLRFGLSKRKLQKSVRSSLCDADFAVDKVDENLSAVRYIS